MTIIDSGNSKLNLNHAQTKTGARAKQWSECGNVKKLIITWFINSARVL